MCCVLYPINNADSITCPSPVFFAEKIKKTWRFPRRKHRHPVDALPRVQPSVYDKHRVVPFFRSMDGPTTLSFSFPSYCFLAQAAANTKIKSSSEESLENASSAMFPKTRSKASLHMNTPALTTFVFYVASKLRCSSVTYTATTLQALYTAMLRVIASCTAQHALV